jgi:ferredoxin
VPNPLAGARGADRPIISGMASLRIRRNENVAGDFFVDETCIDCDLCRQIAPETFADVAGQSAVVRQPSTPDGELEALKALDT